MIITTQMKMDLVRTEKTPTVRLVCNDKLTRAVALQLFADGQAVALLGGGGVFVACLLPMVWRTQVHKKSEQL